jgi:hypothetical protein
MAYKVLKDGATLQKLDGFKTSLSKTSNEKFPVKKSTVYRKDDVIQDGDIAPNIIDNYDNDVGNIRDLIEKIAGEKTGVKKASVKSSKSKKSSGQKK